MALAGILALLVMVDGSRQLHSLEGKRLHSDNPGFIRAHWHQVHTVKDTLAGALTGRRCMYTANADGQPTSKCLTSDNGNFQLCLQLGECSIYVIISQNSV